MIDMIDKSGTIVKQIKIRGTDGLSYTYNISRVQDIQSEERIIQLFRIANNYLLNFKVCYSNKCYLFSNILI